MPSDLFLWGVSGEERNKAFTTDELITYHNELDVLESNGKTSKVMLKPTYTMNLLIL
jgi:hypothetical protein